MPNITSLTEFGFQACTTTDYFTPARQLNCCHRDSQLLLRVEYSAISLSFKSGAVFRGICNFLQHRFFSLQKIFELHYFNGIQEFLIREIQEKLLCILHVNHTRKNPTDRTCSREEGDGGIKKLSRNERIGN